MVRTFKEVLGLAVRAGQGSEESYLNVVVTNGRAAVVTRFTTQADHDGESLYWIDGRRYVCEEGGVCRMRPAQGNATAVLVSSERVDEDPRWSPLPRNHMVVIQPGGPAVVRPIDL